MNEIKFTQGPWSLGHNPDDEDPEYWVLASGSKIYRAIVMLDDLHDAYLIAAAPDLYTQLQSAVSALEAIHNSAVPQLPLSDNVLEMKAALSKARGEQ